MLSALSHPRKKSCFRCRTAKTRCCLTKPQCSRCKVKGFSCRYEATQHGSSNTSANLLNDTNRSPTLKNGVQQKTCIENGTIAHGNGADDVEEGLRATAASFDTFDTAVNTMDWGPDPLGDDSQKLYGEIATRPIGKTDTLSFNFDRSDLENLNLWLRPSDDTFDLNRASAILSPSDLERQGLLSVESDPHISILEPTVTASLANVPSNLLTPKPVLTGRSSLMSSTILGIVISFPKMLVSGSFLPPFINSHFVSSENHYKSCRGSNCTLHLPEILAVCANITQMHITALPESHAFLQRTIYHEQQRLLDESTSYDKKTIVSALQACTIYLILLAFPLDGDHFKHRYSQELEQLHLAASLLRTISVLISIFYDHEYSTRGDGADFHSLGSLHSTSIWRDWIWDESAHRVIALLYTIEILVNISLGKPPKSTCVGFDSMALPARKKILEASTITELELEWLNEQSGSQDGNPKLSVGNLLEAYSSNSASNSETLNQGLREWCKNTDDFGRLIYLAVMTRAAGR